MRTATRELIAEFAPEVVGMSQDELTAAGLLPRWIGDDQVHLSHRSNLIRKDASFYGAIFPTTPGDLEYVWPGSGVGREPDLRGERRWVLRAADPSALQRWREDGVVEISEKSPRGKDTPAWRAQVAEFVDALTPGTEIDVLVGNDPVLAHAVVTGELLTRTDEQDRVGFVRAAEFVGDTDRAAYRVPAVLQDPALAVRRAARGTLGLRPAPDRPPGQRTQRPRQARLS